MSIREDYGDKPKKKAWSAKAVGALSAFSPIAGAIASGATGDDVGAGERVRRGSGTLLASVGGAIGAKYGTGYLAKILSKANPALLKKITSGNHNIAKTRLNIGTNLASVAGSGVGGGIAHRKMTKED